MIMWSLGAKIYANNEMIHLKIISILKTSHEINIISTLISCDGIIIK